MNKELIKITRSLILSIQAHPDYVSGEKGDEWHDLTEIAEDILQSLESSQDESKTQPDESAEMFKKVYVNGKDGMFPPKIKGDDSDFCFVGCGDQMDVAFYSYFYQTWFNHEYKDITDPEYYLLPLK